MIYTNSEGNIAEVFNMCNLYNKKTFRLHMYLKVYCIFYAQGDFLAIFVLVKIPTFFQNGSTSLHLEVVMANITPKPSLALYTKRT